MLKSARSNTQYLAMAASRKGTAKLSEIREIEVEMQAKWEKEKIFEEEAPDSE